MTWHAATLDEYLERWRLEPAGEPFSTRSSRLQPVLHDGRRAMLKVARVEEEARGCMLLAWFRGHGAAPVYEYDDHAVVMARANGDTALAALSEVDDDAVTGILCRSAQRLHEASVDRERPDGLTPLTQWFRDLFGHAGRAPDGFYARASRVAQDLLADESNDVVLHGDLHHGNVLDFGTGADADGRWLAIDPKCLVGHRVFDYTNILCNPTERVAQRNFARRVELICRLADIERTELLRWTVAWCALSATWFIDDDQPLGAALPLRIGMLAERSLAR